MIQYTLIIAFVFGFVAGFCACDIYHENLSRKMLEEIKKMEVK